MTRRLTFVILVLSALPVHAQETWGVALLDDDSLIGWDHAAQPPSGWKIEAGRLSGNQDSPPLLSGWMLGDFELRFNWSVAREGVWQLSLAEVPRGPALDVLLSDGPLGTRLLRGKTTLAANTEVRSGGQHQARLQRAGTKLALTIDGQPAWQAEVPADASYVPALSVPKGDGSLSGLRLQEPAGKDLFNGTDLTGWWTPGKLESWTVEHGEIVCLNQDGNYLRTEREYGNFTLSLEYKMARGGNSGIGIRTPRTGWPSGDGMELQLLDEPAGTPLTRSSTMGIYGNLEPIARADRSEQWNHVIVKADGWVVTAWVNGTLVQHANTARLPELKHRRRQGWIGLQDHGARIQFRNLRLLEAPERAGLLAWYLPAPEAGAWQVLDRLMNPERLATPSEWRDGVGAGAATATSSDGNPDASAELDEREWRSGVGSGVVTATSSDGNPHVLAKLDGPGTIVRLTRTGEIGKIAFYFDGEEQPRIDCLLGQLRQQVPPVSEEDQPLLTCLAYEKSLKIVVRDGGPAHYRFDYVTFPKIEFKNDVDASVRRKVGLEDLKLFESDAAVDAVLRWEIVLNCLEIPRDVLVETFSGRESSVPRGMLPALSYRREQLGWGTHRQLDWPPRFGSSIELLQPGDRAELVTVAGEGVADRMKLKADQRVLDNDDLWIEVSIDGEAQPAVAAPARYLFPGLQGGENYPNFVLVHRDGFTNFLAMPFADGLRISAVNRGQNTIANLGISVAVDSIIEKLRGVTEKRPAVAKMLRAAAEKQLRLRGVFQVGHSAAGGELINQIGAGCWVALIYEQPENASGIESLAVDGVARGGWESSGWDLFFGSSRSESNVRQVLTGRRGGLAWNYMLLAPVNFEESLVLKVPDGEPVGNRLALFYLRK